MLLKTPFLFLPRFYFQNTAPSGSFISLIAPFQSQLLISPFWSAVIRGLYYHLWAGASQSLTPSCISPTPPGSHTQLPSLLPTQRPGSRASPCVLLLPPHSFQLIAPPQQLESSLTAVCLSHSTKNPSANPILFEALPSKCSCDLSTSHHLHPVCPGSSQHYLSHTLLQPLANSSPCRMLCLCGHFTQQP